jgi:prepilin-type N-terminal cleavage/methylation domain-containing protein
MEKGYQRHIPMLNSNQERNSKMIKHLSKEDGITLIELLATLTILSFLIVLTYGILFNGFNYSKKANEQVTLQQEMNLFTTTITKMHESESTYDIVVDANPNASTITLIGKNAAGTIDRTFDFSNSNFQYTLYNYSGNVDTPFNTTTTIDTTHPLFIKIIICNKKSPTQKYEVKTIISRL